MFQAIRQAARRASLKSNEVIPTSLANSSALAVAAVLVALASDQLCNTDNHTDKENNPEKHTIPKSILPFIVSLPKCQCELSAHLSNLRRSVTSKLMAAEATHKTFFSLYEVDFDHPLGQGAYGDVYLCRERISGEECALKKIPKVRIVSVCFCLTVTPNT